MRMMLMRTRDIFPPEWRERRMAGRCIHIGRFKTADGCILRPATSVTLEPSGDVHNILALLNNATWAQS